MLSNLFINEDNYKAWLFYKDLIKSLGITNCMSIKQFERCIEIKEIPYLLELRKTGYRYGDTTIRK